MDDFMNYMGCHNMVIEDKIRECLNAARRGETRISIDCDDLTDSDIAYRNIYMLYFLHILAK